MRKYLFLAAAAAIVGVSSPVLAQSGPPMQIPPAKVMPTESTPAPAAAVPATPGVLTPVPAECLCQSDRPWASIAFYGWTPGIRGDIGVGQRVVNVDRSVSDVVDKVFDNFEGAASFHIEAGYQDVGIILDLMYLDLGLDQPRFNASSQSTLFEAIGFYRAVNSSNLKFDVLAGTRYYNFRNSVQLIGVNALSREQDSDWFDLVLGVRGIVQVTDSLSLWARGDLGGFGIGNSSDLACNAIVGFEYACSDCISLLGGWRWLNIDRDQKTGRDRELVDITLSGPFLALGFRY